jgi:transposase
MIAGINHKNKIIAPMYFEGYTDADLFETWIKKCLIPNLKENQIIVLDNAAFHKKKSTEDLLKEHKCSFKFLPTYSPDLNPIEHKWFVIKDKFRKMVNFKSFEERMFFCFG